MKPRDYTRPEPKPLSWTPLLRGDIYCAPACGYKCTKAEHDKAVAGAKALVRRLGKNWKPHVWENLGWFHQVRTTDDRMSVGPCTGGYHALLSNDVLSGGRWVGEGKTPEAAIEDALKKAKAELERIREVVEGVEETIGRHTRSKKA